MWHHVRNARDVRSFQADLDEDSLAHLLLHKVESATIITK